MDVVVLCSPNGDKGAARVFFDFVVEAEVTDDIVDIGELAALVALGVSHHPTPVPL